MIFGCYFMGIHVFKSQSKLCKKKDRSDESGDKMNKTQFLDACASGNAKSAKEAIDFINTSKGFFANFFSFNINSTGKLRETGLMKAAKNGHTEIAKNLIENGADIDAKNKESVDAFFMAEENKHVETAQLLLDSGAAIVENPSDDTPALLKAAERGHLITTQFLIKKGNNVNMTGSMGSNGSATDVTPIMAAAYNGHIDIVKLLRKNGAVLNQLDKENRSALSYALRGSGDNNDEVVHFIVSELSSSATFKQRRKFWLNNEECLNILDSLCDGDWRMARDIYDSGIAGDFIANKLMEIVQRHNLKKDSMERINLTADEMLSGIELKCPKCTSSFNPGPITLITVFNSLDKGRSVKAPPYTCPKCSKSSSVEDWYDSTITIRGC